MVTAPSPIFPKAAGILAANGTYGLGVLTADSTTTAGRIYVANDPRPAPFIKIAKNGKFNGHAMEAGARLSADGKPQAGMGVFRRGL